MRSREPIETDRDRMLRALRQLVDAKSISPGSMPTDPQSRECVIDRVLSSTRIVLTKDEREVLRYKTLE